MHTEQTLSGERQFVSTSRSGRRYVGTTPEEAERKLLLATMHAFERETGIAYDVCASMFGHRHFGQLSLEQMRELRKIFADSRRAGAQLEEVQRYLIDPKATDKQIKRLVRLGLYVLGPVYGKDWFWRKCKEWVVRLRGADRVDLDKLTNSEAWSVIRRLERIEKRLKATGEINDESD